MKKIFALLCFFIFSYLPITTSANTKEFYIPSINVEATINDDGSVDVVEEITYDFNGDLNGIIRNYETSYNDTFFLESVDIIDKNSNIIKAKEGYSELENTYEVNDGITEIKLYTKSHNEKKTIKIKYRLENIISKSETEGRLYWNFYTVENVDKVNNAILRLKFNGQYLNESNSTYHVYTDGGLKTNYDNGVIDINISDLTSTLAVDLKVPSEFLINASIIDNSNNNFDNGSYQAENDNSNLYAIIIFSVLGLTICLIIFFVTRDYKVRKAAINEYRNTEVFTCDDFYHSPPSEMSPALVNLMINGGNASVEMLSLSLFYLAEKGYYSIESVQTVYKRKKVKDDLKFVRNIKGERPKEKHLKFLIEMFKPYEVNGEFTLVEIEKKLKQTVVIKSFREDTEEWLNQVKEDADDLNMLIAIRNKTILTNYYNNEQEKWIKYKEYLEEVIESQISEDVLEESTSVLIYAKALRIDSYKLNKFNDKLLEINHSNYKNSNYDDVYNNQLNYNNYFMYYPLYNQLYGDVQNRYMPNGSSDSFDGGGFSGSSSGGDFGGGGGGGSDAF